MRRAIHPAASALALLLIGGAACAPAALGSNGSSDTGITPTTKPSPPPPPVPLTSCGDGTIDATGSADGGLFFVATAVRVSGKVCAGSASVLVDVAGNLSPTWDFSFTLQADLLDASGLHVPLGQQVVWTTFHGDRAMVTVDITGSEDAFVGPDGGATPRLQGTFEEWDGNRSITGRFDCPFCGGVYFCIDLP